MMAVSLSLMTVWGEKNAPLGIPSGAVVVIR
jgi:hypothetical protein